MCLTTTTISRRRRRPCSEKIGKHVLSEEMKYLFMGLAEMQRRLCRLSQKLAKRVFPRPRLVRWVQTKRFSTLGYATALKLAETVLRLGQSCRSADMPPCLSATQHTPIVHQAVVTRIYEPLDQRAHHFTVSPGHQRTERRGREGGRAG